MTTTFAFVGAPATHVVTQAGIMLSIFGTSCSSSWPSDCFVRDGELGTDSRERPYVAMSQDGAGHVLGIVDPTDHFFDDPYCDAGCTLHEVEAATRTVTRTRALGSSFLGVAAMEVDPVDGSVFLGVYTVGDRFDGYTAYEIWHLAF